MGGSSNIIFYKVSQSPFSLYILFSFNLACVENSLRDLTPEVKDVRSPRGAVIWFFFSCKFEVTEAKANFEDFRKAWDQPNGSCIWSMEFFSTSKGG